MSDKIDDGGPAFPLFGDMLPTDYGFAGMSLRDWFAGQADVSAYNPAETYRDNHGKSPSVEELAAYIASIRYIEADAMLAARAKGGAQ